MPPDRWQQHNITFVDREIARRTIAERLGPALIEAQADGQLTGWWFMNKQPWPLRYLAHQPSPIVEALLNDLVTEGIAGSWTAGTEALGKADGVELLGQGRPGDTRNAPAPTIFGTGVDQFVSNHVLHEEIFGAASLVIRYKDVQDLLKAAGRIEGQLTASLHLTEADYPTAAPLIPVLEQKVGRIIVNGWPTGVEVGHAMVHGGPFPATSDTRTTSVGTLAINRFLRPVAYQNIPQELLPEALQDTNPWHLNRRINGDVVPAAEKAEVSA